VPRCKVVAGNGILLDIGIEMEFIRSEGGLFAESWFSLDFWICLFTGNSMDHVYEP
jgi:hypothetical protein